MNKRLLLLAGLVLFLSIGQRYSFGLYLLPVTQDMGWGRETFSLALAIQNLVWGLAQPFSGALADKWGAKRVMVLGGAFYVAGLALMPLSTSSIAFTVTAGLLVGLGLSGTAFGIIYGAVGKEVSPSARPVALGIVGAIGSAGQVLMLPVNLTLISGFGWATALLAMSVCVAAIIPLAMGFKGSTGASLNHTGETLSVVLRGAFADRDFWLLTIGFLSCGFQLAFIGTHLPAYLADKHMGPTVATTALGIIGLANIVGTYLFGVWGAKWLRKNLATLLYSSRTAAIVLFISLPISNWTVYAFAAVMGFLWLATVPLTIGILGEIYGMRYVNTLFGVVFLSHQVGSFLGVWFGGWFYDRLGSYTWVWILAAALSLMSAALHYPIREARTRLATA